MEKSAWKIGGSFGLPEDYVFVQPILLKASGSNSCVRGDQRARLFGKESAVNLTKTSSTIKVGMHVIEAQQKSV